MKSLSTVPYLDEFNTAAADQFDTKRKNQKVIGFRCTRLQGDKNSSISSHWRTEEEYLSSWESYVTSDMLEKVVEEIISAYKKENIVHNLDINNLFVKDYKPHASLNLLHSLVDIGSQIFKDARSRNELEAKIIDDFVRGKTRVLSSKKL